MSNGNLVIGALKSAIVKFGHPSEWNTPIVARWVQRQVQDKLNQPVEPVPQPEPYRPNVLSFTPLVPNDEREALISEDGWR